MRIAFFTDNFLPQPSGIATSVAYFTDRLTKMGHTVYIFAPKVRGSKDKTKHVYRLPSMRLFPSLPDGVRLPLPIPNKSFWKMLAFDFDLVHAHGNGAFPLLGLTVAKAKKIPFIQTFHIQIESYAHYFLKGKVIKPELINELFLKKIGNLCDGVITPSKKMADQLKDAGVTKKVKIIPNFVDFSIFNEPKATATGILRKDCHIPVKCPIILSVGRVGKEKNFEFLVRVFEKVAKVNSKAHLVIVGPNWGETEKLINLAKKFGINNRVHLPGRISPMQMPVVYKESDIFVFCSNSETQGMCVLEAAVSGLPIIVNKDAAYEGMVINNKNGYILPTNVDVFANKIINLLQNPKLSQKFSRNSPLVVQKKFNPEKIVRKLIHYYKQIIRKVNYSNS